MIQFAQDILQKIENEIAQVCSDDMVSLEQTSYMVNFIKPLFLELRANVSSFKFEKEQDEIDFFFEMMQVIFYALLSILQEN